MYYAPLKQGDTLGIAAPAGSFDREKFDLGIAQLKKLGFQVHFQADLFEKNRYLAGSDERKISELENLFENPKIKAILFARGGYGCQKILPKLNYKKISKHPKPVIGYSDATPLLEQLHEKSGIPIFYGPMVTHLAAEPSAETLESLRNTLIGKPATYLQHSGIKILKEGSAKGMGVGGCLSLISTSLGTSYQPKWNKTVLFLEDTNEEAYSLDRMLTQLKHSGLLSRCKALCFGTLSAPTQTEEIIFSMLKDVLNDFPGPILTGLPVGHQRHFITVPLGVQWDVDTAKKQVVFHYDR